MPFFGARVVTSTITFVIYPVMMTFTVIWFLGLPVIGFFGFFSFMAILLLTGFVGCAMGLTIGAIFPDPFAAININMMVAILFSFGAGLYANTGATANIFVRLLSWLSPMHYSCILMMRRMFEGKNPVQFT